jgi:hypothetical protein
MADVAEDLSSDQIDRLLAEAETRLASKQAPTAVAKQGEQQISHPTAPLAAQETSEAAEGEKRGQELAVRTARLAVKKSKVREEQGLLPDAQLEGFCMMKSKTHFHDATRYPVMGDAPATYMIIIVHSYSDIHSRSAYTTRQAVPSSALH